MKTHLVTCSYRNDFELCTLLCRSVDQFISNETPHTLIVPSIDYKLFRQFSSHRRNILIAEDVLTCGFMQIPFARRFWLYKGKPLRGWYVQQLLKLSTPNFVDADIIIHVDSDVCFIKSFVNSQLEHNGKVRLYHKPRAGMGPFHRKWHRTAGTLLCNSSSDYFGSDFIAQAVTWRTATVRSLQNELQNRHGEPWQHVLAVRRDWSEYILYGVFVTVAGMDSNHHFLDTTDLCHSSWHYDVCAEGMVDEFIRDLSINHIAVHLQSWDPFSLSNRKEIYDRLTHRTASICSTNT